MGRGTRTAPTPSPGTHPQLAADEGGDGIYRALEGERPSKRQRLGQFGGRVPSGSPMWRDTSSSQAPRRRSSRRPRNSFGNCRLASTSWSKGFKPSRSCGKGPRRDGTPNLENRVVQLAAPGSAPGYPSPRPVPPAALYGHPALTQRAPAPARSRQAPHGDRASMRSRVDEQGGAEGCGVRSKGPGIRPDPVLSAD
jgi:hypothetical protein